MASGSWNNSGIRPGHFCSWSKIQLGWITPTLLSVSQTGINIARLSANAQAYKITSGMASDEYLLVENRQTSGNDFDDSLPGDGLLVYHIDDNESNNHDETHYMVGVLQADGLRDLENGINRGDAGDPFPGSTNNRYLGPDSNPDTDSYYNGDTGIVISNISNSGDPMSFNFGGQPFTIYNDGAGTLSVNSITPESAADWISWGPQAPFDVAPGEYQVVTVSVDFNQAPCGETTTRLLVYSNDANESPYPGGVYVVVTRCAGDTNNDGCYNKADYTRVGGDLNYANWLHTGGSLTDPNFNIWEGNATVGFLWDICCDINKDGVYNKDDYTRIGGDLNYANWLHTGGSLTDPNFNIWPGNPTVGFLWPCP